VSQQLDYWVHAWIGTRPREIAKLRPPLCCVIPYQVFWDSRFWAGSSKKWDQGYIVRPFFSVHLRFEYRNNREGSPSIKVSKLSASAQKLSLIRRSGDHQHDQDLISGYLDLESNTLAIELTCYPFGRMIFALHWPTWRQDFSSTLYKVKLLNQIQQGETIRRVEFSHQKESRLWWEKS